MYFNLSGSGGQNGRVHNGRYTYVWQKFLAASFLFLSMQFILNYPPNVEVYLIPTTSQAHTKMQQHIGNSRIVKITIQE